MNNIYINNVSNNTIGVRAQIFGDPGHSTTYTPTRSPLGDWWYNTNNYNPGDMVTFSNNMKQSKLSMWNGRSWVSVSGAGT